MNNYFRFQQFTIRQDRCAMKVGTDGTLLGAWASLPSPLPKERERLNAQPSSPPTEGGRGETFILDVGTGTGLIALMMAQRFPEAQVTGIDIDADAVSQAQENVAASPFADRITILQSDFSKLSSSSYILRNSFSAIVCNPPFFTQSLRCPDGRRTTARHDETLSYRTLTDGARHLLSDNGELSVIIPVDQRKRMDNEAALAGLFCSRICLVRTSPHKDPKRCLLAYRKHPAHQQTGELTLGSVEYKELTNDFYLAPLTVSHECESPK